MVSKVLYMSYIAVQGVVIYAVSMGTLGLLHILPQKTVNYCVTARVQNISVDITCVQIELILFDVQFSLSDSVRTIVALWRRRQYYYSTSIIYY